MENKNPTNLDYEVMKQKLKEQLRTGKSLFSKGGAFAPLLEELINSMLEGELEGHLDEDERRNGNRKNDKGSTLRHLPVVSRSIHRVTVWAVLSLRL